MHTTIEGKVIVITGASSGLGEAAARMLSKDAISQPDGVDINEILSRPTAQKR